MMEDDNSSSDNDTDEDHPEDDEEEEEDDDHNNSKAKPPPIAAAAAAAAAKKKGPVKAKNKKSKFKKNPNAPKRFRSAFIMFSQQRHSEIREQLKAENSDTNNLTGVAKMVSQEWKDMSPEQKEYWRGLARKDMARFEKEKAEFKGSWKVSTNEWQNDPTRPKKPSPAYFAFSNARRQEVKQQNPNVSNAELSRILSKMWQEASDELKQSYISEETRQREIYVEKFEEWRKNKDIAPPPPPEEIIIDTTDVGIGTQTTGMQLEGGSTTSQGQPFQQHQPLQPAATSTMAAAAAVTPEQQAQMQQVASLLGIPPANLPTFLNNVSTILAAGAPPPNQTNQAAGKTTGLPSAAVNQSAQQQKQQQQQSGIEQLIRGFGIPTSSSQQATPNQAGTMPGFQVGNQAVQQQQQQQQQQSSASSASVEQWMQSFLRTNSQNPNTRTNEVPPSSQAVAPQAQSHTQPQQQQQQQQPRPPPQPQQYQQFSQNTQHHENNIIPFLTLQNALSALQQQGAQTQSISAGGLGPSAITNLGAALNLQRNPVSGQQQGASMATSNLETVVNMLIGGQQLGGGSIASIGGGVMQTNQHGGSTAMLVNLLTEQNALLRRIADSVSNPSSADNAGERQQSFNQATPKTNASAPPQAPGMQQQQAAQNAMLQNVLQSLMPQLQQQQQQVQQQGQGGNQSQPDGSQQQIPFAQAVTLGNNQGATNQITPEAIPRLLALSQLVMLSYSQQQQRNGNGNDQSQGREPP